MGQRRGQFTALAVIIGWYLIAIAILYPLASGQVADSWIYAQAVDWFREYRQIRFAGFTEAMPVAQVIYGAGWTSLFGASAPSLDLACVTLGILAAAMLYRLAIRCGAEQWQAVGASCLLICNPCYLFLSFSFMTEVPFVTSVLATILAFSYSEQARDSRWLWMSALLAIVAFSVRPFGGALIIGMVGAILIFDALRPRASQASPARLFWMLAPYAIAFVVCAIEWYWLTVLRPTPWSLAVHEQRLHHYLFAVSATGYFRAGVLAPLLYLGLVLSPLALLRLESRDAPRVFATGSAILLVSFFAVRAGPKFPSIPEMSCFGGWSNVLLLRGLPNRFLWTDDARWIAMALGSYGAAALAFAAIDALARINRAAAALFIAAGIYWAATIPLWMFNDRYYLVLVPSGALILAIAPLPQKRIARVAAFAMTAAMGLLSLGGTYSYQRGLQSVVDARDLLERSGIPRSAIDAGYELNGEDLYRYPRARIDTVGDESGIPMITSAKVDQYTIASKPFSGTEIVGRIRYPGPFGLGERELYVLRRISPTIHHKSAQATPLRQQRPRGG